MYATKWKTSLLKTGAPRAANDFPWAAVLLDLWLIAPRFIQVLKCTQFLADQKVVGEKKSILESKITI